MRFSDEQLLLIYDRADGYCHICNKKLTLSNYGSPGEKGGMSVNIFSTGGSIYSGMTGSVWSGLFNGGYGFFISAK